MKYNNINTLLTLILTFSLNSKVFSNNYDFFPKKKNNKGIISYTKKEINKSKNKKTPKYGSPSYIVRKRNYPNTFSIGIRTMGNIYIPYQETQLSFGSSFGIYTMFRISSKSIIINEFLFDYINTNIKYQNIDYSININHLSFPIFYCFKPIKAIGIFLGPSISYNLKYDIKNQEKSNVFNFSTLPLDGVIGVGTAININKIKIYFDTRYYHSIINDIYINNTKLTSNNIRACLGFQLF